MTSRFHLLATGTTSGLTMVSLAEFLRAINWANLLTFLATAITSGISWYVSARQSKREQDRLDREEARQQRLEDVLQELKLKRELADAANQAAGTTVGVAGSS